MGSLHSIFRTISSFRSNHLGLKIGKHVLWDSYNVCTKGFCSGANISTHHYVRARWNWYISGQRQAKSLASQVKTISNNMPTNFEPKHLKPKIDFVEKPENPELRDPTRKYHRENPRMWEIIHIRANSCGRFS